MFVYEYSVKSEGSEKAQKEGTLMPVANQNSSNNSLEESEVEKQSIEMSKVSDALNVYR